MTLDEGSKLSVMGCTIAFAPVCAFNLKVTVPAAAISLSQVCSKYQHTHTTVKAKNAFV